MPYLLHELTPRHLLDLHCTSNDDKTKSRSGVSRGTTYISDNVTSQKLTRKALSLNSVRKEKTQIRMFGVGKFATGRVAGKRSLAELQINSVRKPRYRWVKQPEGLAR